MRTPHLLSTGCLPVATDWKSATVSPVYKELGSRQVATNYRPISLLSVLPKCLEKLVFKFEPLYAHLDKFLPRHQSGFRRNDSTAYQLAQLFHRLSSGFAVETLTGGNDFDLTITVEETFRCTASSSGSVLTDDDHLCCASKRLFNRYCKINLIPPVSLLQIPALN